MAGNNLVIEGEEHPKDAKKTEEHTEQVKEHKRVESQHHILHLEAPEKIAEEEPG